MSQASSDRAVLLPEVTSVNVCAASSAKLEKGGVLMRRNCTVPVGNTHFGSRFISLPNQSDVLWGCLYVPIQAVDCIKKRG